MQQQNVPQSKPDQGRTPQQEGPSENKTYSTDKEKDEPREAVNPERQNRNDEGTRRASQADKDLEDNREDKDIAP